MAARDRHRRFDTPAGRWHRSAMRNLAGSLAILSVSVGAWAGDPVPDFKLVDVNTNSVRYSAKVSPHDYLLQVAGYYFGHAG